MTQMLDAFEDLLRSSDVTTVERMDLPAIPERRLPIPEPFRGGAVGDWILSDPNLRDGLWRHQALALGSIAEGRNVVLSTGTTSGKSLVFQAAALRLLEISSASSTIAFYPLKALASDQLENWRRITLAARLPETTVMRVDGDVLPHERQDALEHARILLMTPDVCHAWLLRNLANPAIRRFLGRLELVIIDEAHILEGVFGSNFAFLFRRLQAARDICWRGRPEFRPIKLVAASATIANPVDHLRALTGLEFSVTGEEENGSPRYARTLLHIACGKDGGPALLSDLQRSLIDNSQDGSFITFVDSRQGAERLAVLTDKQGLVKPYRSGIEADDRAAIESALRSGTLRGVVSTSALELGINIPHFEVGLNLGVPNSRKALRQRVGRVGRLRSGAFAVVAEANEFARYGATFRDYYEGSVEPSHLYLDNRFMQFSHARCLSEELDMLGVSGRKVPPGDIDWTAGFTDVFEFSHVGGGKVRPREFDHIHTIGGDAPHFNYALRNVAEMTFTISYGGSPKRIGTINHQQRSVKLIPVRCTFIWATDGGFTSGEARLGTEQSE